MRSPQPTRSTDHPQKLVEKAWQLNNDCLGQSCLVRAYGLKIEVNVGVALRFNDSAWRVDEYTTRASKKVNKLVSHHLPYLVAVMNFLIPFHLLAIDYRPLRDFSHAKHFKFLMPSGELRIVSLQFLHYEFKDHFCWSMHDHRFREMKSVWLPSRFLDTDCCNVTHAIAFLDSAGASISAPITICFTHLVRHPN